MTKDELRALERAAVTGGAPPATGTPPPPGMQPPGGGQMSYEAEKGAPYMPPEGPPPGLGQRIWKEATGEGQYEPQYSEQLYSPPPANASLGATILANISPALTTDPKEMARIHARQFGKKFVGEDKFKNPMRIDPVTGEKTYFNRPGTSGADVLGGVVQGAEDLLGGKFSPGGLLWQAAKQGGLELARGGLGRAVGSGRSVENIALQSVLAGMFGAGGELTAGGAGKLSRYGGILGKNADEAQVSSALSRHGYDWSKLSPETREQIMNEVGQRPSGEVEKILADKANADRLFTVASAKEGGVTVTEGGVTGEGKQLQSEALLAKEQPTSKLGALHADETQQGKIGGLLPRQTPEPTDVIGGQVASEMRGAPARLQQESTDAFDKLTNIHGKGTLYNGQGRGNLPSYIGDQFPPGTNVDAATSPIAAGIIQRLGVRPQQKIPLRIDEVLNERKQINDAIANIRKQATPSQEEITNLTKIRDGLDQFLITKSASKVKPEQQAAVKAALAAEGKAAKYATPFTGKVDAVTQTINELINTPNMSGGTAFKKISEHSDPAGLVARMREVLPENSPIFEKLADGLYKKHIFGSADASQLKPSTIRDGIGKLLDSGLAKELISADEQQALKRAQLAAGAAAKRGNVSADGRHLLEVLAQLNPTLRRVLSGGTMVAGGAYAGSLVAKAVGANPAVGGALGGAGGYALDALRAMQQRGAAARAVNPSALPPQGPRPYAGAVGSMVGMPLKDDAFSIANDLPKLLQSQPGLMNQPPPEPDPNGLLGTPMVGS